MAKLTMAARRALPKSAFAVPSKAPGPGSYPIPDAAHKRAAAGLAGMHHASSSVKAAIASKHPHRNLGGYLHPKKGR
jgi:hypothetical protein